MIHLWAGGVRFGAYRQNRGTEGHDRQPLMGRDLCLFHLTDRRTKLCSIIVLHKCCPSCPSVPE
jgi:hypothetical protein